MLFVIIGLFGDHSTPAPAPAPAPAPVPAPRPVPAPAPVAPLTTDDELAGTYYKGTFLVGSQIQPGTYSTQGPTTQDDGQWARLSNTTGDPTAVIAHGIVNGPTTVTILPTDAAFQTTGDVVWVKVQIPAPAPVPAPAPQPAPKPEPVPQAEPASASTLPTTFGEGTYLVGSQIAPGTYQTPGTTTEFGGGWYRLSGTTGDHSEIIAVDSVEGPATMTVLPTDHAVKFIGGGITGPRSRNRPHRPGAPRSPTGGARQVRPEDPAICVRAKSCDETGSAASSPAATATGHSDSSRPPAPLPDAPDRQRTGECLADESPRGARGHVEPGPASPPPP